MEVIEVAARARLSECSFRTRRLQNGFGDLSMETIHPHSLTDYLLLKVVSGRRGQNDIETRKETDVASILYRNAGKHVG